MGRYLSVFGAILACLLLLPAPADAVNFPVNSTADVPDASPGVGGCNTGAGACTLRAAVQEANATSGADTITLPAGDFALGVAVPGEDLAVTGDLDITESVQISGAGSGAGGTTIHGAPAPSERVFQTLGAATNFTLSSLRITGSNDPGQASVIAGDGRSLTLSRVVITGNTGQQIVYQFGPGGTAPFFTMDRSTIATNISTRSAVEVGSNGIGRASFTDSSISGNTVNGAGGFPAILTLDNGTNDSRVTITRTTFAGNQATGSEGVVDFDPSGGDAAGDHLSVTDSVFSNNMTDGGEGAIQFDPAARGNTPMTLSLTRTRFVGNVASPTGSGGGGAVFFAPSGSSTATLTARDSTFQNNVAGGAGSGQGGAIEFGGPSGSSLFVSGSTFSGNRAGTGSAGVGSDGGAISFEPAAGTMSITNSTFSGNRAADPMSSQGGGAITYEPGASSPATLTNVTLTGNSVGGAGAGGAIRVADPTRRPTLRNSILFGNTDGGAGNDCSTAVLSGGGNISGGATCGLTGTGDQQNTNPLLAALGANGGATQTHALSTGSPAIDTALAAACPATDQRGVPRPQGSGCDVGAFEVAVPTKPGGQTALQPVLGRLVRAEVLSGRVYISRPGAAGRSGGRSKAVRAAYRSPIKGRKFVRLRGAQLIPVGSFLDTRAGKLRLTTATQQAGKLQSGDFTSGTFELRQSRKASAKGLTELRLKGSSFKRCGKGSKRSVAKAAARRKLSKRRVRRLRSNAKGRFRTRGRYSAATIRGTKWTVTDRCDGTLTTVSSGRVAVRDFRRKKTVTLTRGKRYLAKAPG